MKNLSVKSYVVNDKLKVLMPNSKFAYTIQVYTSGNCWYDSNLSICLELNLPQLDYIEAMKIKFNCVNFEGALFFKTKKQCEEAIEFLDSILIFSNLKGK